ncbi:hypothetical protein [Kineosporia babensis]|uniref:Uncharacterized protein n=1 Tax=Kineosporia babensis TaxID=499548 RepID=A0A9X1NKT1_9ACTN|nr:hypothetical protein [Kineosporia babensis]MCD5316125.1 hypothetical protein [Kineosporia babensis]
MQAFGSSMGETMKKQARVRLVANLTVPSTPAQEVANEALSALLQQEGAETVERVFASVVAEPRLQAFLDANSGGPGAPISIDARPHSHPDRLGEPDDEPCSAECDVYQHTGRLGERQRHWRIGDRFSLVTTDEHDLSWNNLQEIVDYCQRHDLEASASARSSFYFPGRTIQVSYTRPNPREPLWNRRAPA